MAVPLFLVGFLTEILQLVLEEIKLIATLKKLTHLMVSLWAFPLKGINWQPQATHPVFIGVMLYRMLYIVFQFLSLSKRSHCFSTSCSFSPTHPPCFCISSRQGRWQRGLFLLIFHDLYFVSSDVEINFSLGQKQTVLLMCGLRGQLC